MGSALSRRRSINFKLTNSKSGKFQELLTSARANTAPLIRNDSNYYYFYDYYQLIIQTGVFKGIEDSPKEKIS